MGIGELIFILIFILFGLFNLVVRVFVSRARRRKQIAASSQIKPHAAEEPAEINAVSAKQSISDVRQFLEEEPSSAQMEGGPTQETVIETYTGEETVQEQYVSRVLQEFKRPLDKVHQEVGNLQEETFTELEKQALPSLDVSISDQQLSGIGLGDYGEMDFQKRVHRSGWERIQNLPPLKRAIVLSELLGKPKAMDEKNIL